MFELMVEAAVIIVALGGLELTLWLIDHKAQKEQNELLEEIATTLAIKEQKDGSN